MIKFRIKRKGALTRKAKKAGVSIKRFAKSHLKTRGLTGKQARFYWYVLKNIKNRR